MTARRRVLCANTSCLFLYFKLGLQRADAAFQGVVFGIQRYRERSSASAYSRTKGWRHRGRGSGEAEDGAVWVKPHGNTPPACSPGSSPFCRTEPCAMQNNHYLPKAASSLRWLKSREFPLRLMHQMTIAERIRNKGLLVDAGCPMSSETSRQ